MRITVRMGATLSVFMYVKRSMQSCNRAAVIPCRHSRANLCLDADASMQPRDRVCMRACLPPCISRWSCLQAMRWLHDRGNAAESMTARHTLAHQCRRELVLLMKRCN